MKGIDIIDSYRRLPLGKYMEIMAIYKDEGMEDIDKQVKMVSILTDMAEDDILNLPIPDYKELVAKSRFLESPSTEDHTRIAKTYIVGNYTVIPTTDMRKVTTAQYIDFQSFHAAGMDEHLAEIMSCLLIPKGKKYNTDYDIVDLQKAIREDLSVSDMLSLYAFFLMSSAKSIKDMSTFCKEEIRKIKDKEKREELMNRMKEAEENFSRNGVG